MAYGARAGVYQPEGKHRLPSQRLRPRDGAAVRMGNELDANLAVRYNLDANLAVRYNSV